MAVKEKIRIRLKSYDATIIDNAAEKIVETARRTGARVSGPIPLPTEKEIVTILRAVHKYKDSREQFEMRTHKRLIDILKPSNKTVEALTSLQLPAGVDIEDVYKRQHQVVVHDATCPFVAKIHRLARRAGEEKKTLFVAGDKTHPEVVGIVGHTTGPVFVFADLEELKSLILPENTKNGGFVVAQTTFEAKKWRECVEFLKKVYTNLEIFDTICNATWARQHEAECLAKKCDLMVVIGGKHSSNTQKLVTVARHYTQAVSIETAAELDESWFSGVRRVGAVSYTHLDVYKRQIQGQRLCV